MSANKIFKDSKSTRRASECRHLALGIVFVVFSILLLSAFVDFSPEQTHFISSKANDVDANINILGNFGSNLVFFSLRYFGLAAWLIPISLLRAGLGMFFLSKKFFNKFRIFSFIIMCLSASAILEYIQWHFMSIDRFLKFSNNTLSAGLGGIVGYFTFRYIFERIFAATGGAIFLLLTFVLSSIFVFSRTPTLNDALEQKISQYGYFRTVVLSQIKNFFVISYFITSWLVKIVFFVIKSIFSIMWWILRKILFSKKNKSVEGDIGAATKNKKSAIEKDIKPLPKADIRRGNYILPTIELLQRAKKTNSDDDHSAILKQLVGTLSQFGIAVNPGEVHVGPVITRYEISPAPGVRVEKIVNLDKNIALNLRAQSVRILAPVPGRGCVGVELPNKNPQMVCLREILESTDWKNMKADIPVVLGRGTTGEPMINDLSKMPHLLIAGSTGSGKTVCINSIIASLVYHSTPDDLRFIMVDPKIVEMQIFNKLPHMLIPVVTDPKKVPNALKWLISEMEMRYKIFAKIGVRNIAGFNAKILKNAEDAARAAELEKELSPEERSAMSSIPKTSETIDVPKTKMPYIVCIIDELADLMMVAPADIETCVARLAQLARAAGIHLILATQRPSVNVITGIIKANLPSRIAFKVASKVDSRTILDTGGADALLGKGDMLFQPPGASGLLRAQGALVSDDEINKIVEFLHEKNGDPEYAMDVQAMVQSGDDDDSEFGGEDWEDDMMPKALEVIRASDRASTSLLQRRLKIGYNRAARIMEALEAKGLVNTSNNQDRDSQDLF